uniref:hypothetical protein n=1 Tax=Pseudomonas sp. PS01302 TaxID=2991438 RepID=UPI00249B2BEF
HFHADHPVFSCSKSEQKQLNTWVSFQSAEEPLLGQFSVSGNTDMLSRLATKADLTALAAEFKSEISQLEVKLTIRMGVMLSAAVGVMIAAMKLMH